MSRPAVYRSLPPLAEVLKDFSDFPEGRSRQDIMIAALRKAAKNLRRDKSQPFYSMREVAAFFGAPLGAVSLVYQALEREGFLNRLRSSQTILTGRSVLSKDALRGVVGFPVWLNSMMILPYTRNFVMQIEERLRHSGYLADIIFHNTKLEETNPEFASRLLRHRLDVVVLQSPSAGTRSNILSLRERGVRVIVIQRSEEIQNLPAVIYLLNLQRAYQKMAKRWLKVGIRKVWMWSPLEQLNSQAEAASFLSLLRSHRLEVVYCQDEPGVLLKKIQKEPARTSAIAFLDSTNSEHLCNCHPTVIEQIFKVARVAFCVGDIRVPYLQHLGVKADMVTFSPSEVANYLSDAIGRLSVLKDGVGHTFYAQYHEQVTLQHDEIIRLR